MNPIHTYENNFTLVNISTSCTTPEKGIIPILSMLFRLKYKQKFELLNNNSNSSDYLPDKKILNEEINAMEVCLKEALKKFNP